MTIKPEIKDLTAKVFSSLFLLRIGLVVRSAGFQSTKYLVYFNFHDLRDHQMEHEKKVI